MCESYEVARIIGIKEMIKLQSSLSGWRYIAKEPSRDNPIRKVIGYKLAKRLGKHLAAERVWIGMGYVKAERNRQIRGLYSQGVSSKEIAQRYSMTPRNVRHIVQY